MISATGLFLALATAVTFSAFGLLSRVLARDSKDPLALSVAYGLLGALFSLPLFFIEPWRFGTITPIVLLITFVATVCAGLFETTEFFARKHLEASRMTILFQLTPVVTFFGSIALLNESFSLEKISAIILIIGGNIIAMQKHGGLITKIGLLFGLATVVSLGFMYIADKAVFTYYPLSFYVFLSYIMPSIYIFTFLKRERVRRVIAEWRLGSRRLVIFAAISVLGYYLLLKTFQVAEASVAVPIIYTSTILTALGGIFILKEKSNIYQKLAGAVFVFFGVALLR